MNSGFQNDPQSDQGGGEKLAKLWPWLDYLIQKQEQDGVHLSFSLGEFFVVRH